MAGNEIVRKNLMERKGYSPYCGNDNCLRMPRTNFDGKQFVCPACGWRSEFPDNFMDAYKARWSKGELKWKVNTPQLLKEIGGNPGMQILKIPINIFANFLEQVATRCSEINDPKLNELMCRLALYDACDPYSKGYDKTIVDSLTKEDTNE